jgi:deazaflavin-dependent oxidoreductase (nitroreductase family)
MTWTDTSLGGDLRLCPTEVTVGRVESWLSTPCEEVTEMNPQDYSARVPYRPPAAWYRRLNGLGVLLTSSGLAPADAVTLQVRGRRSGKVRRVPILRTRYMGEDYLVALAGESQWVRNVRAAQGGAVIRRRKARGVRLVELDPADRPAIIAEYLRAGRRRSGAQANAKQAHFYFGLEAEASIEDIRGIAENYPVFRIDYLPDLTHSSPMDGVRRDEPMAP